MFDMMHCTFLRLGDVHRFGPPHPRQIVRKMAVQIATEKSRGNETVTIPMHPEFVDSLRAARAAGIIGAEVLIGRMVRGRRVLPMNKKAWAAKFKKYAVLAGVNEPKKSCHGVRKSRAGVARSFQQIPSNKDKESAFGSPSIQARAMLRVENARLVPVSASLFMDIAKAFGRIRVPAAPSN
jgi:integrase